MNIRLAVPNDIEGIFTLLKKYHVNSIRAEEMPNGFVTTNMTSQQMETLINKEKGITIAVDKETVVGFAMAGSWAYWSEWPLFAYMIEKLPEFSFESKVLTEQNSYQYGPICIDGSVRGTGVFEKIFYASLASMRGRYPIMATFINQINPRSYAAHTKKVSMTTAGTFHFNQNDYYLMACPTTMTRP